MEQGKTPYFSDIDDFMNGLNTISPLTPEDFENDDTLVKIDETCQIHSASEPEDLHKSHIWEKYQKGS
ncbi:CGH_1_collapsed_G0056720.mRNA.1.CDS.1 [Saccharomyces cerevisiae]|nr:CGH_1_collapsed_G0056720.mRNA.1.CDS.1 [Saccharomyces cerevisiae]